MSKIIIECFDVSFVTEFSLYTIIVLLSYQIRTVFWVEWMEKVGIARSFSSVITEVV